MILSLPSALRKQFAACLHEQAIPEGLKPSLRTTPEEGLKPSRQTGTSWEAEYAKLAGEIKTRHYSPGTFKTYRGWVRNTGAIICIKRMCKRRLSRR